MPQLAQLFPERFAVGLIVLIIHVATSTYIVAIMASLVAMSSSLLTLKTFIMGKYFLILLLFGILVVPELPRYLQGPVGGLVVLGLIVTAVIYFEDEK